MGTSSPALPLLEDALKLPFTVFTTKQKQKFLKWYDELNAKEAAASAQPQREKVTNASHSRAICAGHSLTHSLTGVIVKEMRYQVVDVEKNNISLMDLDSGEVQGMALPAPRLQASNPGALAHITVCCVRS